MTSHRWVSSTPLLRTDEDVQSGEEFEPTEAELKHFGDQIQAIETDVVQEAETSDDFEEVLEDTDGVEVTDDGVTPESDGVAFDADAWMDDHDDYQDRVETVESGVVDDVLEEIEAAERSDNVIDAVEARRDELDDK